MRTRHVYHCSSIQDEDISDRYVTGTGAILRKIHPLTACEGEHCVIHNPSDHPMKGFPTHWRSKVGLFEIGGPLMERICPHGIGHPDPDHIAAVRKLQGDKVADGDQVHGCDGCCTGDGPEVHPPLVEPEESKSWTSHRDFPTSDILHGPESD